jgi:exonuclease III
MRRILLGLLFPVLFLNGISSVKANAQQQEAVVVGWNILGVDPIPQTRIRRVARVIQQLDADLVVLTEVNPNDAPQRIVQELGAGYQPPVILTQRDTVVQNIAFVFKTGVSVSGARLIEGTDLAEEPRSRKSLTANVRIGNFDFILIGVHLKSSRDTASRNQRTRQCTRISEFITQAVAGNEKDVLVIGDYNMIPRIGNVQNDGTNFTAMNPTNFLRFVSTDSLVGQTSHIGGCNPLRGNMLDGFAISRNFTSEYVAASTRLVAFGEIGLTCNTFFNRISDHRPIVSKFRITTDDD